MSVTIVSHFTDSGVPKTGLSPTIRIRTVSDGVLVVTDEATVEIGDGAYKYVFTSFDPKLEYSIRVDGTATLDNAERYQFATNEAFNNDIRQEFKNKKEYKKVSETHYTETLYGDDGISTERVTEVTTDGTTEVRQ